MVFRGEWQFDIHPTTRASVVPMEICSLGRVYGVSSP